MYQIAVEEPLETQLDVQDEEEHKKERNRNYKRESQAWLATIDGNVKSMLLPRFGSTQSSIECHLIRIIKEETLLISTKARSCVLPLVDSLQGYDVGVSTKSSWKDVCPSCDETIDAKMFVQPTRFNK